LAAHLLGLLAVLADRSFDYLVDVIGESQRRATFEAEPHILAVGDRSVAIPATQDLVT
jgi:hypothetical protein